MENAEHAPLDLPSMTADEYLAWAEDQPQRYEMLHGKVYAMPAERSRRALCKFAVAKAFSAAIEASGRSDLHVYPDGMAVKTIDGVFEPDAQLRQGDPLDGDALSVPDPLVIVEILSPGTRGIDLNKKLNGYLSLDTVRHFLIIDPEKAPVIHHAKQADGTVLTRLVSETTLNLDPPGLLLDLSGVFEG